MYSAQENGVQGDDQISCTEYLMSPFSAMATDSAHLLFGCWSNRLNPARSGRSPTAGQLLIARSMVNSGLPWQLFYVSLHHH